MLFSPRRHPSRTGCASLGGGGAGGHIEAQQLLASDAELALPLLARSFYLLGWWVRAPVSSQPQCLLQTLKSCHVRPHSPRYFSQCSSELYLGEGGYFDRRRNRAWHCAERWQCLRPHRSCLVVSCGRSRSAPDTACIRSLGGWTFGR